MLYGMNKIFHEIKKTIRFAYKSLLLKKTRTTLTILGISIGIAIVIAIMSAGRGLNAMILSEMDIFGPNTINIEIKVPTTKQMSSENMTGISQGVAITTLNDKDRKDIENHPNIVAAYGYMMGQEIVSYEGQTKKIMLAGEGYQMIEVEKFEIVSGRMYTKDEEDSLAQVAVLGYEVKKNFFGDEPAEGKIVRIAGKPFRVVGTAAKRGSMSFINMDDFIYIPVKTLQKRLSGIDYFTNIIAKMKDSSLAEATIEDLEITIRENHDITDPNKDDFAIMTMDEAAEILETVINGIIYLLVVLICVSLVVGGVGIMNIMYVSVTERTFEIGLRKALGASNQNIMWQFLAEAIIVTIAGGVVGIIFGALFAFLIYIAAVSYNLAWIYSIPVSSIILSISFSAIIGIIFGLYPAKRAASLDPIEALRKE